MMNEEQLIQRASGGDMAAFNELLGLHEKRMYGICLRMCRNPEDAQDCLQEAMLRVFRAITGFKGQSTFSTWLYRITMNACIDELRRRKNAPQVSMEALMEDGWTQPDPEETPERNALQIIAILFGVMQYSARLDTLNAETEKMSRFWMNFMNIIFRS